MFDWDEFRQYDDEMHRPEHHMVMQAFNEWLAGNDLFVDGNPSSAEMSFYLNMFKAGWIASQLLSK